MKQPVLNVGIMADTHLLFSLETSYHHGTKMLNQGDYSVRIQGKNMVLEGRDMMVITRDQIVLLPVFKTSSFLLRNVTIGIQFHWEQKEDQRFTGGIRFLLSEGKIWAINTIHLEDYIKSVISSEMDPESPFELLKAHAVVSRSWLLAQLSKEKNIVPGIPEEKEDENPYEIVRWYNREDHSLFDVCADDHCQRYRGITKSIPSRAAEAVDATTGMILMHNLEICDTRYSKCCGGVTESYENVWEPDIKPYLTSVEDMNPPGRVPSVSLTQEKEAEKWIRSSPPAFCNVSGESFLMQFLTLPDRKTADFYRWRTDYTQKEISEIIRQKSGIDFGDIVRLEPLHRGYSGRISKLRIVGTLRTIAVGKELEIRKWLSPTHLYSSAFTIEYGEIKEGIPGTFTLYGAGWGHGAGLCQIGAAVMAHKGFHYLQILSHYFRNAEIKSVYDE